MNTEQYRLLQGITESEYIEEAYVLLREVKLWMDVGHDFWRAEFSIKIWLSTPTGEGDEYFFTLSHYVKTPDQAGPYRPSRTWASSEESAIRDAISATRTFLVGAISNGHEPSDDWLVRNPDY